LSSRKDFCALGLVSPYSHADSDAFLLEGKRLNVFSEKRPFKQTYEFPNPINI